MHDAVYVEANRLTIGIYGWSFKMIMCKDEPWYGVHHRYTWIMLVFDKVFPQSLATHFLNGLLLDEGSVFFELTDRFFAHSPQ